MVRIWENAPARAPANPVARPPGWLLLPPGLSLPSVFLYMSKDASSIAFDGIVLNTSATHIFVHISVTFFMVHEKYHSTAPHHDRNKALRKGTHGGLISGRGGKEEMMSCHLHHCR